MFPHPELKTQINNSFLKKFILMGDIFPTSLFSEWAKPRRYKTLKKILWQVSCFLQGESSAKSPVPVISAVRMSPVYILRIYTA